MSIVYIPGVKAAFFHLMITESLAKLLCNIAASVSIFVAKQPLPLVHALDNSLQSYK